MFKSYTQVLWKMKNIVLILQKNIFKKWSSVHRSWEKGYLVQNLWEKWKISWGFVKKHISKKCVLTFPYEKNKKYSFDFEEKYFQKVKLCALILRKMMFGAKPLRKIGNFVRICKKIFQKCDVLSFAYEFCAQEKFI